MSEPIHITKTEGKWNATALRIAMEGLSDGGYIVTLDKDHKKRSSQQNRYYWGVVVEVIRQELSKAWGERQTAQGVHELLRLKFLAKDKPLGVPGEVVTVITSTTELDTIDMVEYTEKCRDFARDYLNVEIDGPNEQQTMSLGG